MADPRHIAEEILRLDRKSDEAWEAKDPRTKKGELEAFEAAEEYAHYVNGWSPMVAQAYIDLLKEKEQEEADCRRWEATEREGNVRCVDCGIRYAERKEYGCLDVWAQHRYSEAELEEARRES